MFQCKQITAPADLARYKAAYQRAAKGVSIADDYLRRARRVMVAYDTADPDVYLGGYIINDEAPMRYFVAPGEAARDESLQPLGLTEDDLVEIGAIWLARYHSLFRELHRLYFFGAMLYDACQTQKPYVLGGSFVPKIQADQKQVLPRLVYANLVTVGMFTGLLQLYVGPRQGIWQRFAKCALASVAGRLLKALAGVRPDLRPVLP